MTPPDPASLNPAPPAPAWPDPPPRLVTTRLGPVEVADAGAGPAVLALHGAMGGYDQSLLLARTVGAAGLRYLAPSRPGYLGTSLARGRDPADQARLYAALLDALGVERVAVLAVSGGGPSALEFARLFPERCWAAVIVSSVWRQHHRRLPASWRLFTLLAHVEPLFAARRRAVLRDPDRAAQRAVPDPVLRARTLADPAAGPLFQALQLGTLTAVPRRLAGTKNDIRCTLGAPLALALEAVKAPTLVIHGTEDEAAPFTQGEEMAARIPDARLVALRGGGHAAIFTHRAEAQAAVARFLLAHAPPPDAAAVTG